MSVTFTRSTLTYNPETGESSTSTSTVVGSAVRVRGQPHTYQALGLVMSEAPTLLFTPNTYGECPRPGDTVTWANVGYTVRDVDPIAPDGVVIAARVIVVR